MNRDLKVGLIASGVAASTVAIAVAIVSRSQSARAAAADLGVQPEERKAPPPNPAWVNFKKVIDPFGVLFGTA